MENNEDKRQETVLAELHRLIDTISFTSIDQGVHDVVGKEQVKSLIESLLPKERELLEKVKGENREWRLNEHGIHVEIHPQEWFNKTFKPYNK